MNFWLAGTLMVFDRYWMTFFLEQIRTRHEIVMFATNIMETVSRFVKSIAKPILRAVVVASLLQRNLSQNNLLRFIRNKNFIKITTIYNNYSKLRMIGCYNGSNFQSLFFFIHMVKHFVHLFPTYWNPWLLYFGVLKMKSQKYLIVEARRLMKKVDRKFNNQSFAAHVWIWGNLKNGALVHRTILWKIGNWNFTV